MEYLILFLPLLGSIISGFFGKKIGDRNSQILTSFFVSISAILSLFILTVAAAEAAIGLAIIVVYFRNSDTIRVEEIKNLKG